MGIEITETTFDERNYARFEERVRACVAALRAVLARPGFGEGPGSLGAELELDLIDGLGRPAPINRKVLAETVDPRVTLEVDRFNLEINADPVPLAGAPFSRLAAGLEDAIAETRRAAARHGAEVAIIGILPTLTEADLYAGALTEANRYQALSAGIRRLRHDVVPLRIEGQDRLELDLDDVTYEGANTSFQVHLRVAPADYARTYNAVQIATAPALAVAGNSPLFFGRRLWDETRVALFRQSADDRAGPADNWRPSRVSFGHGWVRHGAAELFAESVAMHEPILPIVSEEDPLVAVKAGRVPGLSELRLHQGTVWRWNRAVYDPAGQGHLRIELRAFPAGPTVADMAANAAFVLGLALGLRDGVETMLEGLTFGNARQNFYEAARRGLDAILLWPDDSRGRVQPVAAPALVLRLLSVARRGLSQVGVDAAEQDRWLSIIERRAATGRTGARWLAASYAKLLTDHPPLDASRALLARYQDQSHKGPPVHDWEWP